MPAPEKDELKTISETYLPSCDQNRRRAILAEARRLRGRLSSIPWYAEREKKSGPILWLRLAISYAGED